LLGVLKAKSSSFAFALWCLRRGVFTHHTKRGRGWCTELSGQHGRVRFFRGLGIATDPSQIASAICCDLLSSIRTFPRDCINPFHYRATHASSEHAAIALKCSCAFHAFHA
jgi:hypothetical protein